MSFQDIHECICNCFQLSCLVIINKLEAITPLLINLCYDYYSINNKSMCDMIIPWLVTFLPSETKILCSRFHSVKYCLREKIDFNHKQTAYSTVWYHIFKQINVSMRLLNEKIQLCVFHNLAALRVWFVKI